MLLSHVPLVGNVSASKLIWCFSNHPVAFGLQATSTADNITVNAAYKKTESESFSFSD